MTVTKTTCSDRHNVDVMDFLNYLTSQNEYHTFASAVSAITGLNKRLQVQIGGILYRVLDHNEIVYEGSHVDSAVQAYNEIR